MESEHLAGEEILRSPRGHHFTTRPVGANYPDSATPSSSDPTEALGHGGGGESGEVELPIPAAHAAPPEGRKQREFRNLDSILAEEDEIQRQRATQGFSSPPRRIEQRRHGARNAGTPEQQLIDGARELLGLNQRRSPEKDDFKSYLTKALLSAPFYPLRLVQKLISMGYEPVAAKRQYSIIYREYRYYYPGVIGYFKGITQQDGWRALYRGVGNAIIDEVLTVTVHSAIQRQVNWGVSKLPLSVVGSGQDVPDTEENIETARALLLRAARMLVVSIITQTTTELVVRPIHVILYRSMAQHVGKENLFSTIWGAAREIYQEEGLSGLYTGIVPVILGHICSCFLYTALWFGFEIVAVNIPYSWGKTVIRGLIEVPILAYFPRSYSYPFYLMSTLMAVNNCRLKAGLPPQMPVFNGWVDCYHHLRATGQLYRGSMVLLPRFAYKTPPI